MCKKYVTKKISEELEKRICELYKSGLNGPGIIKIIPVSKYTISNVIYRNNLTMRDVSKCQRKISLNEDYFEKIDSEEKAYWLGFLSEDGSCHSKTRIELGLQDQDYSHLEKFKKSIESEHEIKRRIKHDKKTGKTHYGWRIQFRCKKMFDDLKKLGVVERKSYTLKQCLFVPKEFEVDYVRGLIDGDGSLSFSTELQYYSVSLIGTYDICKYFIKFIANKLNWIEREPLKSNDSAEYYAHFGGRNISKDIVELLYKNAKIFLERKNEIAYAIMSLETIDETSYYKNYQRKMKDTIENPNQESNINFI